MSKAIEGVPESFTREQYVALFDAVGLSPYNIMSLEFRAEGVYAVVFERDAEGQRILIDHTGEDGGWAKHRIFIPVEGGLPKREDFRAVAEAKAAVDDRRLCDPTSSVVFGDDDISDAQDADEEAGK